MPATADDRDAQDRLAAFLQGLQQSGWSVGRNVRIESSWTSSDADSVRKSAADLVALAPDVILANGSAAMGPLLRVTRAVPVVFAAVADPVGAGYTNKVLRKAWMYLGGRNCDERHPRSPARTRPQPGHR
jgi:putative ABC transport system substrate-binding protein